DHQNQVCLTDGGQTVCNQEGGSSLQQTQRCVLDELLGLCVNRAGRLIQHKDGWISQYRPCKGDQLFFTGGELIAAFADIAVISIFQMFYYGISGNRFRSLLDLLISSIQPAITDI